MRWPIIPTIIVAAAIATMIALGIWQIQRGRERDAQAVTFAANSQNIERVTYPLIPPIPDAMLYRRSSVVCLEVTGWQPSGGVAADGTRGFRFIAQCRTGAEGPGALIDMGVSTDPQFRPRWTAGIVTGRISLMPGEGGMLARLFGGPPPRPLLVSEAAPPGLLVSAPPDPTTRENSSWAYAAQWFIFAAAAAVIYVLALRRRGRDQSHSSKAKSADGGGGDVGTGWSGGSSAKSDHHDGDGGGDGGGGD
jgi:surfeit locus 1 family protein